MTNILKITRQIHDTIDKINEKYGLEINIYHHLSYSSYKDENDYTVVESWRSKDKSVYDSFFPIEEKQIKQILIALNDMLGENPEYEELENGIKNLYHDGGYDKYVFKVEDIAMKYTPATLASSFCHRWLDGLNPLFESEPELVLEELLEVLENLIK